MIIHELTQGTPEWHAHRAQFFNASDAPAMMGASSYKTRTQLMDEMVSSAMPEVDARTQALFDEGHRCEALARAKLEADLGEDLYPMVGSVGRLSASFDGLTLDYDINFEHKLLNDRLRDCETAMDLPPEYRIQMEQQMMISGATLTKFIASKWDKAGNLLEWLELDYESDLVLRDQIERGWAQFEKDLANHKPMTIVEKPRADAIMQLPALAIQIKGEVTLSNLPVFKQAAIEFIDNIKTDLASDEDFANAEANVKFLNEAEKQLDLAKQAALSQTADIDELMRTIDKIQADMRTKRLALDKLVKEKKEKIKADIIEAARTALASHMEALNREIAPVQVLARVDYQNATKGKRTLTSLHDAVNTEVARAKIEADAQALIVRTNLAKYHALTSNEKLLFSDLATIAHQDPEHFALTLASRLAKQKEAEAEVQQEVKQQDPHEIKAATPKSTKSPKSPSRTELLELVADTYGVTAITARKWLIEMFSTEGAI